MLNIKLTTEYKEFDSESTKIMHKGIIFKERKTTCIVKLFKYNNSSSTILIHVDSLLYLETDRQLIEITMKYIVF